MIYSLFEIEITDLKPSKHEVEYFQWEKIAEADFRRIVTTLTIVGLALLDLTSTFQTLQEVYRFGRRMIQKR